MALVRIDDLAPAAALTGAEVLEVEQGGVSLKVTAQEIADLGSGGGSGGSGDVVGPGSAVADRIAVFDGTTGKSIKDGGMTIDNLYLDTITAAAVTSGTVTLNCNGGRVRNFTIALTANATLAVSNLAGSGRVTEFECQITQDATGSRTLALPSTFRALGGSDTSISAAANAVTILSAKTFDNGTTWRYAMQESA